MKKIAVFILLVSLSLCCPVLMKRITHGFRIEKMKLATWVDPVLEVPALSQQEQNEIKKILTQKFTYLNRGAQCYVFESEDGGYVIKLFRFDQKQNPIRKFFRHKVRKKACTENNSGKISQLFFACKLAYTLAREETELFYLHLNPTENELPLIFLKGPLGRKFSLPLDSYRFALQKKAEPLKTTLVQAIASGTIQDCIDSLFSLWIKRAGKGIGNSDGNLFRNFGFIGNRAIEIDFGNYGYSSDLSHLASQKKEIGRFANSLRIWLESNAPEWVEYVDRKMNEIS